MEQATTTKEIDRLNDWLKANGHSAEDTNQCIKYVSGNTEQIKIAASDTDA